MTGRPVTFWLAEAAMNGFDFFVHNVETGRSTGEGAVGGVQSSIAKKPAPEPPSKVVERKRPEVVRFGAKVPFNRHRKAVPPAEGRMND